MGGGRSRGARSRPRKSPPAIRRRAWPGGASAGRGGVVGEAQASEAKEERGRQAEVPQVNVVEVQRSEEPGKGDGELEELLAGAEVDEVAPGDGLEAGVGGGGHGILLYFQNILKLNG